MFVVALQNTVQHFYVVLPLPCIYSLIAIAVGGLFYLGWRYAICSYFRQFRISITRLAMIAICVVAIYVGGGKTNGVDGASSPRRSPAEQRVESPEVMDDEPDSAESAPLDVLHISAIDVHTNCVGISLSFPTNLVDEGNTIDTSIVNSNTGRRYYHLGMCNYTNNVSMARCAIRGATPPGNSSCPVFFLAGDDLVLLCTWHMGNPNAYRWSNFYGPVVSYWLDEIQNKINQWEGNDAVNYQIDVLDRNAYDDLRMMGGGL